MTPARIAELREVDDCCDEDVIGALGDCLDAIESLEDEIGQTLNRLQAAHEERDALRAEVERLKGELVRQGNIASSEYAHASRYRAALEKIANDGNGTGMGGGLRRDGNDLRDLAREALGGKP